MAFDQALEAALSLKTDDSFRPHLDPRQQQLLGDYFSPISLRAGEILIRLEDGDRAFYILEQGSLQVMAPPTIQTGRRPVSILRPGAVVGESTMLGDVPAMAQVEAMSPAIVWVLPRRRFDEMALRQPELALEVLRAMGLVAMTRVQMLLHRGQPMV